MLAENLDSEETMSQRSTDCPDPARLRGFLEGSLTEADQHTLAVHCRWLALLIGRGEAYLLKGDLDRALTESDQAVRFAPSSAEARLLRAQVHARREEKALAEIDQNAAAGLAPDPMFARPEPRAAHHRGDPVTRPSATLSPPGRG